jgi:hypothetical protein
VHRRFYTDIAAPLFLEAGADLMLLHPDGSEELLVAGGKGSVTDPVVSLDGQWVFYALIHDLEGAGQWQPPRRGSDIFRIHVASRRIEQLTTQAFTPNTGAASWSKDARREESDRTYLSYGVMNLGPAPCPAADSLSPRTGTLSARPALIPRWRCSFSSWTKTAATCRRSGI